MPFDGADIKTVVKTTSVFARVGAFFAFDPLESFECSPPILPDQLRTVTGYDILLLADALISKRRNWMQRRYETYDGRRCAVGAIRAAYRHYQDYPSARRATDDAKRILRYIISLRFGFHEEIEKFNDVSSYRTVRRAFAEAIAYAK